MFRPIALVLAACAVPAIAAAQATQFNLLCSGTLTSSSVLNAERVEPYSSLYRIDLATQKWCEAECKALHDISSIQPAQLTLEERKTDTLSEKSLFLNMIDRETGAHKVLVTSSTPRDRLSARSLHWEGTCEPAPFTGFPTLTTKF